MLVPNNAALKGLTVSMADTCTWEGGRELGYGESPGGLVSRELEMGEWKAFCHGHAHGSNP